MSGTFTRRGFLCRSDALRDCLVFSVSSLFDLLYLSCPSESRSVDLLGIAISGCRILLDRLALSSAAQRLPFHGSVRRVHIHRILLSPNKTIKELDWSRASDLSYQSLPMPNLHTPTCPNHGLISTRTAAGPSHDAPPESTDNSFSL